MSILFKALNKAASDYRTKKAPIIIPLMKMPPAFNTKKRFRVALGVIATIAVVLTIVIQLTSSDNNDADTLLAENQTNEHVQLTATESGIALPASAFDEVESQIEATKALSAKKKSNSRITVSHSNAGLKRELEKANYAIETGAWDEALKIYQAALETDPFSTTAMQGKVYVLGQRGTDDDLIQLEQLAIDTPLNHQVHAARARILAKQKHTMGSLAAWKRAYKLAPRSKDYGLGLAITLDKLGREDEALNVYSSLPKPLSVETKRRLIFLNTQKMALNTVVNK